MEGFQAKEVTSVERKTKESPFEICLEIHEAESRGLGQFLFTDELPKYLFQFRNPKTDIVWGSQECDLPLDFL